jgi:two-component system response regulator HydG
MRASWPPRADLPQAVAAGQFLEDLYYRLKVVQIEMPDLCDRLQDIPQLAEFLLAKYAARANRQIDAISPGALDHLCTYDWPGSVRELENTIERAAVLGSGTEIEGRGPTGRGAGGASSRRGRSPR